ncbi:hypothetical protein [Arthrobacter sp. UYCo732]|uniref:hypothetical protein n=1 Tax=Arthrobacter sp. UYCo732 TaxID=3156336 RepID=UPI0033954066
MYQQDNTPVAPVNTAAPSVQEFYFPRGGGTDPDFSIPAEQDRQDGGFLHWLRALPVFGR